MAIGIRNIIRESILDIRHNKVDYAFLFFQFVVFVGAVRQLLPDSFLIINLAFVVFLLAIKNKLQITSDLFFLTIIYILIIIIPLLTFDTGLRIYIGFYIRLLTSYFIIKYFGFRLMKYFENLVFILAVISIPLFIIQLINPLIFNLFNFVSHALLTDVHLSVKPIPHKYLVVFLVNGWALNRNSGFTWEPAAFGAMLAWALLFNLFINRFVINKKAIILFLVALSTFSLGTYVYLSAIVFLYLAEKNIKYGFYLLMGGLILFLLVYRLPLIQENYNMMKEKTELQSAGINNALSSAPSTAFKTTRLAGFYTNWNYFLKWPWAYGFADNSGDRRWLGLSSNGLMTMVARWGIPGIIILLIGSYKMIIILKEIYYPGLRMLSIFIGMVLFILPLSGNPFHNRPFSLALVIYGIIMSNSLKNIKVKLSNQNTDDSVNFHNVKLKKVNAK